MNIDEFLDSVAANNLSKTPIQSSAMGVNAVPSDALVRNVMNSKFVAPPMPSMPGPKTSQNLQSLKSQTATTESQPSATNTTPKSPSASTTPAQTPTFQASDNASEQFESLSFALETSLASADYQHAFDTYIALQSSLAHLYEQQKKQQRQFQDRLNDFKTRLFAAVQLSTAQFQSVMQELYLQIGQIKQQIDANQIDAATSQYASVKQTIDQLPNNFSDKKEKLQDELLKVYLYLKDKSETHTASSFTDISNEMKRLYVSAVAAIKTLNFAQAQQLYEQLAAKYAQLPDGFTEQKVQLFDYVTFLHSQLTLESSSTQSASSTTSTTSRSPTQSAAQSAFAPTTTPPTPKQQPVQPLTASKVPKVTLQQSQPVPQVAPQIKVAKVEKETTVPKAEIKPEQKAASKSEQDKILKLLQSAPRPDGIEPAQHTPKQTASATTAQTTTQPDFRVHITPTVTGKQEPQIKAPQTPAAASKTSEEQVASNPNLQSAQQLQERAKKLAARLTELKQSLEQ